MSTDVTNAFTLYLMRTTTSYPIMDDSTLGGLEWHYASGGKSSPFVIVLDANAADLTDSTSTSGWKFVPNDEIEIRLLQTPTDDENATPGTIYRGVILDVEPILAMGKGRWLKLSGWSWGDHWLNGKIFEKDYSQVTPDLRHASQVLNDIVAATHPEMEILPPAELTLFLTGPLGDAEIKKNFEAAYCSKAMYEVCDGLGLEYQITSGKLCRVIPIGLNFGSAVTQNDLLDAPRYKVTSDGFGYDQVVVHSANNMYAPNNESPTGVVYCNDKKFWEARVLGDDGITPLDELVANFVHDGLLLGGCYAGMALGWNNPGTDGRTKVACTIHSADMKNDDGTVIASNGLLNILEADWDALRFVFTNNFDLSQMYIRLNEGKNGSGGWWVSTTNFANQISKGVTVNAELLLPHANPDAWLKVGSPTHIDEIQFLFIAASASAMELTPSNPTILSYLHFVHVPKSVGAATTGVAWPRQLLIIDRTLSDDDDIAHLRQAEELRVKVPALLGTVIVDGGRFLYAGLISDNANHMIVNPGDALSLEMPYFGLFTQQVRVDHIANQAVNGLWHSTIAFGPFAQENVFELRKSILELVSEKQQEEEQT